MIGGSAGSGAALRTIAERLRRDLPAAVFVVQHVADGRGSLLASMLDRWGPLPAVEAEDDALIRPGVIHVAPSGQHLLLDGDHVRLRRGPPENRARPAIDPLFRSAAAWHDGRTVGVLLSGYLTDGAAGLYAVQRCGGLTIVQDPADAQVNEMPAYALDSVEVDYVASAPRIGELLNEIVDQPAQRLREVPRDIKIEARMAAGEGLSISNEERLGEVTPFACPDCNGNLWEIRDGRILRYRCHVGHAYSGEVLAVAQDAALDQALWSALRALRERAVMLRRLTSDAESNGRLRSVASFSEAAKQVEEEADTLQRFIVSMADRGRVRLPEDVSA